MPATEQPLFDFTGPGGQFNDLIGPKLTAAATLAPTKLVHHVTGTTAVTTITPPWPDFVGPLYLIADSVFSWTLGGNIGAVQATTLIAAQAYGFIYDRKAAKWYSIGQ